jgi:hypothetical protein
MNIKSTTMNSEEIKRLLEKYYSGESSLEEELVLRNYFGKPDVSEELTNEKAIFRYYQDLSEIPEPSVGFEDRIVSAVEGIDNKSVRFKNRRIFGMIAGIAATILIITGSYFFFINRSGPAETFSDPEIAYAETIKILYAVSSRLNQGTKELERINSMRDVTRESIETISKSASSLTQVYKPLDDLSKSSESIGKSNEKK